MDAFESVIAMLLRNGGLDGASEKYWTITGFKVDLSKDEKKSIGRATTPRWEIDVVAYNARKNEVLAVECKSFLNSGGVMFCRGSFKVPKRYKLFAEEKTRRVVLNTLKNQLAKSGLCQENPSVRLCLAAGKLATKCDREGLCAYLKKECDGKLLDSEWINERILAIPRSQYENEVAHVAVKLYHRALKSREQT